MPSSTRLYPRMHHPQPERPQLSPNANGRIPLSPFGREVLQREKLAKWRKRSFLRPTPVNHN